MRADSLVGRRVVVRRRIDSPTHRFSDVVGQLEAAGETVVVRTEDGDRIAIAAADVHRIKPVPPGPAEILELERIAALGWPAPEIERLGGWLLRAGDGWTGRANSVLPLADPGRPLIDAIGAVRAWYAARGLPARFAVPLPAAAPLDHVLQREGFTAERETAVLTARLVTAAVPDLPAGVRLESADRPSDRWLGAAYGDPARLPPVARSILAGAARPVFITLVGAGTVLAHARAVADEGWLGITALSVRQQDRRRGLASALLLWLHRWGLENGAAAAYLQVLADNAPARALYRRSGYQLHHTYRYRVAQ
ncbi:MAG: GNAT family N-acetyltransferase [Mycobacteriales bacterium]